MQFIVVAVTMPSLLMLSRTPAYSAVRMGGALFAGLASVGWIAERLLGLHSGVDGLVDSAAHHALWIGVILFLVSFACWSLRDFLDEQITAGRTQANC